MRVHKPKVEYKLALQERPKGAPWRIIIKQITQQGSIKTRDLWLVAIKSDTRYRFKNFIKNNDKKSQMHSDL